MFERSLCFPERTEVRDWDWRKEGGRKKLSTSGEWAMWVGDRRGDEWAVTLPELGGERGK